MPCSPNSGHVPARFSMFCHNVVQALHPAGRGQELVARAIHYQWHAQQQTIYHGQSKCSTRLAGKERRSLGILLKKHSIEPDYFRTTLVE